jgi:hypothetical protein
MPRIDETLSASPQMTHDALHQQQSLDVAEVDSEALKVTDKDGDMLYGPTAEDDEDGCPFPTSPPPLRPVG